MVLLVQIVIAVSLSLMANPGSEEAMQLQMFVYRALATTMQPHATTMQALTSIPIPGPLVMVAFVRTVLIIQPVNFVRPVLLVISRTPL